eukprot:scaffold356918_cov30-Prasinocladus_malaysianus.AAC.1
MGSLNHANPDLACSSMGQAFGHKFAQNTSARPPPTNTHDLTNISTPNTFIGKRPTKHARHDVWLCMCANG